MPRFSPGKSRHTGERGDDAAARQVYFVVQVMLIDPAAGSTMDLLHQLIDKALLAFETPEIKAGLKTIVGSIARSRHFEAIKLLRSVSAGAVEMFLSGEIAASQAA